VDGLLCSLVVALRSPHAVVQGLSPVHAAAKLNWPAAVDYLVRQKADVNKADYKRTTPLHSAAKIGAAGVVRVLLAAGADPSKRDRDGNTGALV